MLKVLIMDRPDDWLVVEVSMLPLEPRATAMMSGFHLDTVMARVGWVPVLDMPEMITLPVPTCPVAASYGKAVTLAKLDVKSVLPSALRAMPWFVCQMSCENDPLGRVW